MSVLILKNREDLKRQYEDLRWFDRPSFDDVHFDFKLDGESDMPRYAKRIKNLFNDCGCGMGTIGLAIGAVLFFIYEDFVQNGVGYLIIKGLIVCTACAVAGKFTGLALSYVKLKWLLAKLMDKAVSDTFSKPRP